MQIKQDVEVQAGFVRSIASAVSEAGYGSMEDVVAFVKWMDEELAFLVSAPPHSCGVICIGVEGMGVSE